ncbi:MAG TPA: PEP/pyruvate-binding domain-containing protein, partial [Tepidiformaceae bacterium]|nr:PEP/pyruvate-binding domain-containing protein [Tepidiformaceae bacterium]
MPFTVPLNELAAAGRARVGGKAASLGSLADAGFAVPDAFAIPVEVAGRLRGPVDDWPEGVRAAILAAYRGLAGEDSRPVAVRSSGTDEDSEAASFAGLHETILDVRGEEAFLDAVAACLESLYSPAAVAYR